MTKRSFFRRFGAIIATIALAPEIAFNVRLPLSLVYTPNIKGIYEQLRECERMGPSSEPLDLEELIAICYRIKRFRHSEDFSAWPP